MIRNPVVAGQFYPGVEKQLKDEIKSLRGKEESEKADALGVVSPHAGYIYSGHVAALTLASIKPKHNYVIIGPNHTGLGAEFGISSCEAWKTPLGEVRINDELAETIAADSDNITREDLSSSQEHSIEVQLPFLQTFSHKDFGFVPIVASCADVKTYRDVGKAIAKAARSLKIEHDLVIIASSDMTHYESQEAAKEKDRLAIEAMLELDEEKFIHTVSEHDISMCGYAPVAIMITAVKSLGAKTARLIKYETSGDRSGDYSSVVGYAGIVVS